MTIGLTELAIYALALVVLVMTPGPVVVALIARTLSTGWRSAMPLSFGVALFDMIWPLLAIFGLAVIVQVYGEAMLILRYFGAAILIWMGWRLWTGRKGMQESNPDPALMRKNAWEGFVAGLLVSAGNPKAILFFVGVLPNLFDLQSLNWLDITVIVIASAVVPFLGNCVWTIAANQARRIVSKPSAVRRVNQVSGATLTGAGIWIAAS